MSTTADFCLRSKAVDLTDFVAATTEKLVYGNRDQFNAALDNLNAISADKVSSCVLTYAIGRTVHAVIENHQPNRAGLLIEWVRKSDHERHMPMLVDQMGEVLASCLHPSTHITAAKDLSAAFASGKIAANDYPRLDAAVARRLPRQLPSHHQLDLLGERLPLLLAVDLPQTRMASTNLLCSWLMTHHAQPLAPAETGLLRESINAHFDTLEASSLGASVLRNRVTDYLVSLQDLPVKPLDRMFNAITNTGTGSTVYWSGLKPYEKSRILTAVNDGPVQARPIAPRPCLKTRLLNLIGFG